MSDPADFTPGVKKNVKRFAPVKRGAKTPGTSRPDTVKTEPEQPKSTTIGTIRPDSVSSGRLQSVNEGQKPRGSSIKMKFKPTVPLKRNKKEVSSSAIDDALNSTRGRGRGGVRGAGRGRGRGRGRGGIIIEDSTASGIFSLGPSAVSRSGMSRPGYGGGASMGGDVGNRVEADSAGTDMTEMFTTSTSHDTPVTFNHISRMEGDVDPITLSQKVDKIPWMSVRSKKNKEEETETKIKKEDEEDEEDKAQEVAEEETRETVYMDNDSPAQNIFALDEKHRLVCVAEDELLYFQLPPVIPNFEKVKEEEPVVKEENVTQKEENQKGLPAAARKSTLEESMGNLDLKDMPTGQVGRLIVYKSGKMKMQFGHIMMDVTQGMHSTFLENVMVVDHESDDTKKAIELGHIVEKFVCSPDMDVLLKQDEKALK